MTHISTIAAFQRDRLEDMRRHAAREAQLIDHGTAPRFRTTLARLLRSWAARLDDDFASKPSTPTAA